MTVNEFENEEKILVNKIVNNVNISKVKRENVIKSLSMSAILATDDDVKELVTRTKTKLSNMTDSEWEEAKKLLPWDCEEGTDAEEVEALEENA